jgi:hypothetical protein
MNYTEIKNLSKSKKCTVQDLLALSPQNDPFYMGQKGQGELAKWFKDLWDKFGYADADSIHLRRIHYQIISQDPPVCFPNGTSYENTKNCSATLDRASKAARYSGLVDPAAFDDRRNGKPIIFDEGQQSEPEVVIGSDYYEYGFYFPELPSLPSYSLENFEGEQRYHIEVWAEKSTMNDVLLPLCERHKVNLITGLGELSITQVVWLMDRIRPEKPCRILYISDFDPAGKSMPVAVSRKIEKFVRDSDKSYDIRLSSIVLTEDQCQTYRLPRTPIKVTERRAKHFEEQYGTGATELDALEALHPGELKQIIEAAILRYRDDSLGRRVGKEKAKLRSTLNALQWEVHDKYSDEIEEIQNEHAILAREFNEKTGYLEDKIQRVWHGISSEMEAKMALITKDDIPESGEGVELDTELYDSSRDYLIQLLWYKQFQGK